MSKFEIIKAVITAVLIGSILIWIDSSPEITNKALIGYIYAMVVEFLYYRITIEIEEVK